MASKNDVQSLNTKLDAIQVHLNMIKVELHENKQKLDYILDNLLEELENIKKPYLFLSGKYDKLREVVKTNKNKLNKIKSENLCLKETFWYYITAT